MEPSSLALRSSASPMPSRHRIQQQNYGDYSLPPQNDAHMDPTRIGQTQGLGLFGYSISNTAEDEVSLASYPQSITSPNFPIPVGSSRYSSQPSPNILLAEYDPFASFSQDLTPYGSALHQVRSTATSLPPSSPSPPGAVSHRSSFSSAPASECYSNPEHYPAYHSRTKTEGRLEWPSEARNAMLMATTQTDCAVGITSTSCFPGALKDTIFEPGSTNWSKNEALDGTGLPNTLERLETTEAIQRLARPQRISSSVARTRTPRRMTTREDANYQCLEKGCGKFFSRSYNFKAHMETHDAGRIHPFACSLPDCGKKFVRKTDLQRHHQSVHMKERNHQCDFCYRFFARKDTLRRHMEDGCAKRLDVTFKFDQPSETGQLDLGDDRTSSPPQFSYAPASITYPGAETRPAGDFYASYSSRSDF